MTEAPVALSFFDPASQLHGEARAGVTLLFEGDSSTAIPGGPTVEERGEGYSATLEDRFELAFSPVSPTLELAGARSRVCEVTGRVGEREVRCLGIATETVSPPAWAELDAVRSLAALFDEENVVLAVARRPRGAQGHGEELVTSLLISAGELLDVEEARISTVYDGEGRQRSVGLELWLPGEDFPRRVFGEVVAGTSLALDGLDVHAAVFGWKMDGREGAGAYDLMVRSEPPEAA